MKKYFSLAGYFLGISIGILIIISAMTISQNSFNDIIREYSGQEEMDKVISCIFKFVIALIIGIVILYKSILKLIPHKKIIVRSIAIILFLILAIYRIYHFVNYNESELINLTKSTNWVANDKEAVFFKTPAGMEFLQEDNSSEVKFYKDDNITIIFGQNIYDNYSEKSDINIEKVKAILIKQISDITKLNINEVNIIEEKKYGNIQKIVLEANLNNRGIARIYAIERNSDITMLTIMTKNTEDSNSVYEEFMRNLTFTD